jgi:GT2 family glycosyltransferase
VDNDLLASVIIVNYNGLRFLSECLTAVQAQQLDGRFEVVLVDNGSRDGSEALVRSRFPDVRVIQAGRNLGFAGGNNLGIRGARGRFLVLLNNDTRVRPGWLGALVRAATLDETAGAVTAKLLFMDPPNTIQNAGSLLLSDGSGADRGFREPDTGQYEQREEVFGACGASVLYRRQMLDDVGLFDERFFMYYEDTDLNWRMRLRGWKVLYEPAAVVDHVHAGSSVEWSPMFIFHVDRNRLFMILKNAPWAFVATSYGHFGRAAASNAARALRRRLGPGLAGSGMPSPGRAAIHLHVVASIARHLPEMMWKRRAIRRGRKVADTDIARWFYPRERWHAR